MNLKKLQKIYLKYVFSSQKINILFLYIINFLFLLKIFVSFFIFI